MSDINARKISLSILREWEESSKFIDSVIERKCQSVGLNGRDRAYVQNLTLGVIRNLSLLDDFVEKLKLKMPEIVYIYSQNSAINFLKMIKNYQLETLWMNTNLMCIGEKTSSILNEIKWKKIFLFNPGEEEFLLYKI